MPQWPPPACIERNRELRVFWGTLATTAATPFFFSARARVRSTPPPASCLSRLPGFRRETERASLCVTWCYARAFLSTLHDRVLSLACVGQRHGSGEERACHQTLSSPQMSEADSSAIARPVVPRILCSCEYKTFRLIHSVSASVSSVPTRPGLPLIFHSPVSRELQFKASRAWFSRFRNSDSFSPRDKAGSCLCCPPLALLSPSLHAASAARQALASVEVGLRGCFPRCALTEAAACPRCGRCSVGTIAGLLVLPEAWPRSLLALMPALHA